jgi:hypothetical protein
MNQEDILRMARQAGFEVGEREHGQSVFNPHTVDECCLNAELERFAALVAAAQREKVAHWMRSMGYATGHGDTVEDLLGELRTQEREACAKYVEQCSLPDSYSEACLPDIANELRARGNK